MIQVGRAKDVPCISLNYAYPRPSDIIDINPDVIHISMIPSFLPLLSYLVRPWIIHPTYQNELHCRSPYSRPGSSECSPRPAKSTLLPQQRHHNQIPTPTVTLRKSSIELTLPENQIHGSNHTFKIPRKLIAYKQEYSTLVSLPRFALSTPLSSLDAQRSELDMTLIPALMPRWS